MILTVVNPKERQKQNITFPIVGNVDLNDKGQFDCPDDKVETFCKAVAISFPFSKPSEEQKEKIVKQEKKLSKKEEKALREQAKKETENSLIDADILIEAITEATDLKELEELVRLVPGADKDAPKDTEGVRKFLLDKIKEIQGNT